VYWRDLTLRKAQVKLLLRLVCRKCTVCTNFIKCHSCEKHWWVFVMHSELIMMLSIHICPSVTVVWI